MVAEDGSVISGWDMRSARYPARVPEEHSETAYITNRAMEFMAGADERPWLLHLSYIKPHWPYVAPAPYHVAYGAGDIVAAVRSEAERHDPHPVYRAFMDMNASRSFARDEVRETVIPAYMGLIEQIDRPCRPPAALLDEQGAAANTVVVFTSDHGDYLGDHWLGEKELFHESLGARAADRARPVPARRRGARHDRRRAGGSHRPAAHLHRNGGTAGGPAAAGGPRSASSRSASSIPMPRLAAPATRSRGWPPTRCTPALNRTVILSTTAPAAAGRIGVLAVKNAAPDGATLLLTPIAPMSVYQHVYKIARLRPDQRFRGGFAALHLRFRHRGQRAQLGLNIAEGTDRLAEGQPVESQFRRARRPAPCRISSA